VGHAGDDGHVQGPVEWSIAAAVEPMASGVSDEAGMGLTTQQIAVQV